MLVWWFVGVQPCFNALIEDHVPEATQAPREELRFHNWQFQSSRVHVECG